MKLYLPRFVGDEDGDEEQPQAAASHAAEAGHGARRRGRGRRPRAHRHGARRPVVRAIEARDGPSGLEILQSNRRIDLLITDIGLPGLNGRQVADAARVLRPGLKVPFMTGYSENAALASGFLEPGMQMVTKPFAMEMFAQRVRDMLRESQAASAGCLVARAVEHIAGSRRHTGADPGPTVVTLRVWPSGPLRHITTRVVLAILASAGEHDPETGTRRSVQETP